MRHAGRPAQLPRPQIKPGLRRVWRDARTVQIGLTPDAGVVVAGLEPAEAELLDRLDGTRPAQRADRRGPAPAGSDAARVAGLLDAARPRPAC